MNMTDHCNAIHRQATRMRSALWSLVFGATAAGLVWKFDGAPWWVYALLFTPSVFGFARALTDEPTKQKRPDVCLGELPVGDVETGALAWKSSGLSPD